jgi:hypothetical protein
MSRQQLADLTGELAPFQDSQREQQRRTRRGTERRRAAGAGPRLKLTPADRVLATVLYLRKSFTQALLAELFTVDRKTITIAVQETRPLLDQHGYLIAPSTARFHAPADLPAFLAGESTAPQPEAKSARYLRALSVIHPRWVRPAGVDLRGGETGLHRIPSCPFTRSLPA